MDYRNIIKRPIISEKSMRYASLRTYTFEVSRKASKGSIKKALEEIFDVTVKKVRTMKNAGKEKRSLTGKRFPYRKSEIKKAMVQVEKGQKIDLFESKE